MLVDLELRKTIAERTLHRVQDSRRMRDLEIRDNVLASRTLSRGISNRAPERKTITFRGLEMFRVREHLTMPERKTEMRVRRMETGDRKLRLVPGLRRMCLPSEDNRHRVQARPTIILRLAG